MINYQGYSIQINLLICSDFDESDQITKHLMKLKNEIFLNLRTSFVDQELIWA